MTEYNVGDLKGRSVIDRSGKSLGVVEDISVDPTEWRVLGVVVSVDKDTAEDLNLERTGFGGSKLSLKPERVATFGENVILNVDANDIAALLRSPP